MIFLGAEGKMRIGELAGKEIININDGIRLGIIGETDMNIDRESGAIKAIILPRKGNLINFWLDKQQIIIPWDRVRKVGYEVLIVDIDQANLNFKKHHV